MSDERKLTAGRAALEKIRAALCRFCSDNEGSVAHIPENQIEAFNDALSALESYAAERVAEERRKWLADFDRKEIENTGGQK